MRIPPIQCLLTFEALARIRHVGRTAHALCVTPSTVSQRIRLLEHIVGTALFGRRDFSLTHNGMAYLQDVREVLNILQRGSARCRHMAQGSEALP